MIGNEIYLPHLDGNRITVHAIDADGPSAPLRAITGVGTAFNSTLVHIDVH